MDKSDFKQYFENSVKRYSVSLAKLAFTYTKNMQDAEDIVQNIFLKFYQKEIYFDDDEKLKAWLIRCTINECKDNLKSIWKKSRTQMPEQSYSFKTEYSDVVDAVLRLKKNYRIVIHLFYFESMSAKEIADVLKISQAAVEKRLSRARKILKADLEKGENRYEKPLQKFI